MDNPVEVIFRIFKDGVVIALFPTLPDHPFKPYVTSYMHVGQHGHADYNYVVDNSRPATPDEYAALKHELETIGYNLDVYGKRTPGMRDTFNKRWEEIRHG